MSEAEPSESSEGGRDASTAGEAERSESREEQRDADGLPVDRPATLDDVRGDSGSGRTIAIGCTVLVALLLAGFWTIRALLLD